MTCARSADALEHNRYVTPAPHARDLVEETRRSAARMAGIDGRSMRAVHSAALKFLKAQNGADADFIELIREKVVLAIELTEQWR